MKNSGKNNFKIGQVATIIFEDREFDVIVIDPNGIGKGQPSLGCGFRMIAKYSGIAPSTLSDWQSKGSEGVRDNQYKSLQSPSGKLFRVFGIMGEDNNFYSVVEFFDLVNLIADVAKNPGKIVKKTKHSIIDFLAWFSVKGLYAEAYLKLKGEYTPKDSKILSDWMKARMAGKPKRRKYTDLLQSLNCKPYEYGNWTNYVYLGLFGIKAKEMKQIWDRISESRI